MQLWKKLSGRRVPCPHCDSRSYELLYTTPNVHMAGFRDVFCEHVVQCRECGFAFTNPRLSAENLETYYSRFYHLEGLEVPRTVEEFLGEKHREIWFSKRRDFALVQEQKSCGHLLDIGCASGSLLWLARTAGFSVAGVEVGRESAAFVKNVLGIDVFCGQLEDAPFREQQFDAITMFHSLEHVPNPRAVLRTVKRLLNDDGIFIAVVPNFASWSAKSEGARWKWLQPQNHYSHFTPESLARMAEAEGFESQIASEEGRYGEEDIRAHFTGDEISRIYEERRGSELILVARKQAPLRISQRSAAKIAASRFPAGGSPERAVPTVTVLIDTYNHERFIEEALASVFDQDFPREDMEILVVDDGSTDRTREIVAKFAPRVRLIRKENGGQASAFNAAIPEARGEIVAFLDGDDWWAPDKLKSVAEAMAADPSLGIVGHGIVMVHRDGRQQTEVLREGFRFCANTPEGARLFRLRQSLMGTSRMTIRTDVLRRIGPVPQALRIQADAYLFTLAAALAEARILAEPLTYYRYHEDNGFQLAAVDLARLRNKQISLDALAKSLAGEFARHGIDRTATALITSSVQAEADEIRLVLDGGSPLATFRTEWTMWDVHHPSASLAQRLAKRLALLPSLVLPPRAYYKFRERAVANRFYRRVGGRLDLGRARAHVENEWRPSPATPHSTAAHKT